MNAAVAVVAVLFLVDLAAATTMADKETMQRLQNDNINKAAQIARLQTQLGAIKALSREKRHVLSGWLTASRIGACKTRSDAWNGECELGAAGTLQDPVTVPKNAVKCAGENQNNTALEGILDCDKNPKTPNQKGSDCPDNLSSGRAYVRDPQGNGLCVDFSTTNSFSKMTISVTPNKFPGLFGASTNVSSFITKMGVAHPNLASKTVGLLFVKRIKCSTGASGVHEHCEVFKTVICIKCPVNMFDEEKQVAAETDMQLARFVDCCVKGQQTYLPPGAAEASCPTNSGGGAFNNKGKSNANLKQSYVCTGSDKVKSDDFLKGL